uniref:Cytochrome b561 domain-containing protein n=1 Tax=Pyrodinium bahamense TaxID=73915 RepID=A0A7S0BA41_9DINO
MDPERDGDSNNGAAEVHAKGAAEVHANGTSDSPEVRKCWLGNWTVWWVVGLATSITFFWPTSPILRSALQRVPAGPCFILHVVASGIITAACFFNVFHTPSHGPTYCLVHRWLGRVGMVASYVGLACGLLSAWWERWSPSVRGTMIGLSVVASIQFGTTTAGLVGIRLAIAARKNGDMEKFNKLVRWHRTLMIALWVACMAPGWFRLPHLFGASKGSPLMFLGMLPVLVWTFRQGRAMDNKTCF